MGYPSQSDYISYISLYANQANSPISCPNTADLGWFHHTQDVLQSQLHISLQIVHESSLFCRLLLAKLFF